VCTHHRRIRESGLTIIELELELELMFHVKTYNVLHSSAIAEDDILQTQTAS